MTRIYTGILSLATLAHSQVADLYTSNELFEMQKQLANRPGRFSAKDLKRYGNHYTMLAYRTETGSSEIHQHEADIFIVESGEATIILGGKMIGGHVQKPGELRGASIEGGERRPLKTGDIIHIPAGMPHQLLISRGKPLTYFVLKVSGQ